MIFQIPKEFIIQLRKPLTEFEKNAIDLVNIISKWDVKKHKLTNLPARYIRHLIIEFDENKGIWKYE